MNEDWYFVISNSEGDTRVTMHSAGDLLAKLREGYWGSDQAMTPRDWEKATDDTNYWGARLLIIKGTVSTVTPPGDWRIE